jgi:hypothetical protein
MELVLMKFKMLYNSYEIKKVIVCLEKRLYHTFVYQKNDELTLRPFQKQNKIN